MSPRRLIATALVIALAAGSITAIAMTNNDDDGPRTITINGVVRDSSKLDDASSLDTLVAKGQKLSFRLVDAQPGAAGGAVLRGHVERNESGQITCRIEARR